MKRILSILLLTIFVYNYAGYYLSFGIARQEARDEMRARIVAGTFDEGCTVLKFHKDQLASLVIEDEGRELRNGDKVYDIINTQTAGDSITFHCIADNFESHLLLAAKDHVSDHVSGQSSGSDHASKKVSKNIVKLFYEHASRLSFLPSSSAPVFNVASTKQLRANFSLNTPPPEQA